MKYKNYIIFGSFVLAGILLWYFLRPTRSTDTTENPYLKDLPAIDSAKKLSREFQEKYKL